jgi:hypothetical protein
MRKYFVVRTEGGMESDGDGKTEDVVVERSGVGVIVETVKFEST